MQRPGKRPEKVNPVFMQGAFAVVFATIVIALLNLAVTEKLAAGELAGNSGAVVFTGADERIEASLELLANGATDRLFISGANPNAGIRPKRFFLQFGPRHPKLREMLDCCIEFGPHADTTLQNALETRCWLERHELAGSIVLVTSADHMPRAYTALRGFVSDRELIPFPVPHETKHSPEALRSKRHEYIKYVVTLFLIQMPEPLLSSLGLYGHFANGCPAGHGSIPYTGG
jgi:uncharacterized SAM-binding protein YcdF (DUF218 family)